MTPLGATKVAISTFVDVDVTIQVKMGTYNEEWDTKEMFAQVLREAEGAIRNLFSPARISGYTIKKMKATAVMVQKEQ